MPTHMRNLKQTLDVRTLGGLYGSAFLAGAGGVVAAGTRTAVFLDDLGNNVASGLVQQQALSNFFGGRVEQGEILTLFGFQMMVYETDNVAQTVASTVVIHAEALRNLSFELQLKGSEFPITSVVTAPCPLGTNTLFQNGGRAVAPFRFPRQIPLQLNSNDQWSVTVTAQRAINVGAATNGFRIFIYCPASKGIPLGQLSGA